MDRRAQLSMAQADVQSFCAAKRSQSSQRAEGFSSLIWWNLQGLERTAFDDESERKRELVAERAQEQNERMREAYNQLKYTERDKMDDMREQVHWCCGLCIHHVLLSGVTAG